MRYRPTTASPTRLPDMAVAQVRRAPTAVSVAIALAWGVALTAQAIGAAELVHHDYLIEGGVNPVAALVVFLIAWQLMIAAMMLPSSMPMIRLYSATVQAQPRHGAALAAFLAGYALVWSAFGVLALVSDVLLHRLVDSWDWLAARPYLISGAVLVGAGAFQFSKLKDKCLDVCRHPGIFLMRNYRRGTANAFRLGRKHGLFCLGCCWALMLLMFAVGMANLVWMAALAALMAYEKIGRRGREIGPAVGVALIGVGLLVMVFGVS
jgi:predicted metal-binding membrane protein